MECTRKFHLVLLLLLKCTTISTLSSAPTPVTSPATPATSPATSPATTPATTPTTTPATTPTTPTTVAPGGACTQDTICAGNMTCVIGVCGCNASYYPDGFNNCLTKIPILGSCSGHETHCVDSAECNGTPPTCRLKPGQSCIPALDQCMTSSVCENSSSGVCKIKNGQSCSSFVAHCVSNANCNNSRCACGDDYYPVTATGVCQRRIAAGQSCNITNDNPCVVHANCHSLNCTCDDNFYNNNGNCASRLGYIATCTSDIMCQANFTCSGPDGGKKCSCPPNTFREGTSCKDKNTLAVTITKNGDYMETEVRVQWTQPTTGNTVHYTAVLGSDTKGNSTVENANFVNLTPGTEYSVSVTAYVQKETFGSDSIGFTSTQKVLTKPAQPGQLVQNTYVGNNSPQGGRDVVVEFYTSVGVVDNYTVTITQPYQMGTIATKNASVVTASFTNLTPDKTYTVTITAKSNNITSADRNGSFRVPATSAGEVLELTIPETGSRWVRVTWKKPENPNGVIQGYTVRVSRHGNPSCVAGVSVRCSDCTYNNTLQNRPDTSDCTADLSQISKTLAELNNTALRLDVNVTPLLPDLEYDVQVVAFNQAGRGMDPVKTNRTGQEAAENLKGLTVTFPAPDSLNVTWTPGVRTGPTNYTVTWAEETSLGSNVFNVTVSTIVQDYYNQTYTIPDLLSYWNYNVSVHPIASLGPSPYPNVTISRTTQREPGKLKVFNITQPSDSAQTLTLTVSCPEERERNGPITAIKYISTVIGAGGEEISKITETLQTFQKCPDGVLENKVNVSAEWNYNFSVFAVTSTGLNGTLKSLRVYVDPKAPTLTPSDKTQIIALPPASSNPASQTSYAVDVCSCLANPSQGQITFVALIVCKEESDCQPAKIGKSESEYRNNTPTWTKFKDGEYTGKYRPTPDDWNNSPLFTVQMPRGEVPTGIYIIGNDTTCDQAAKKNGHCNGPLPSNTRFFVIAVACTKGGCSEYSNYIRIETLPPPDERVNVGAIVGGIIAALVVIAIVVVVVIFVIRRKPFRYDRPKRISDHEPDIMKPVRKPVKLKDFAAHLDRLHKDSNLLFQEEFEEVQENSPKHFANDAACLDANKVKNRYVNILPFDHTRVKLNCDDDEEFSDFINANYIPGYSSPREYIATQGPIACTIDDFWRMIWEQKSSIIVMLSDLSEKGRAKVELYWPTEVNSPVQYGDIIVELTADSTLNKCTIRNFKILIEHQEERRVTQYFIPGWEDYGANLKPDDLLDFTGMVRTEARSSQGPITVHCSAGVGRTGTFIALDFLMQFVKDHNLDSEVDIYNLVINMRHNRPHMVQSEKQYVFIHDALQMIIDRKIRAMQEAENENLYQNTNFQENVYANQAFEPDDNLYENSSSFKKPTTSL